MAPSEAQKRASAKWNKEHMMVVGTKLKKADAEKFKQYCKEHDTTANEVLRKYVMSLIGDPDTTQDS